MTEQLVLTVEEMAQKLRVSRGSAYELVKTGQVHSVRIGRTIRVPLSAVHSFLNASDPAATTNPNLSEGAGNGPH